MLVLDANFAMNIVKDEEMREPFLAELEAGEKVVVPSLYYAEVANALWKHVHAGDFEEDEAAEKMSEAFAFVDDAVAESELLPEVFSEAVKHNHPAYDLFYLVLARRYRATLCTLDAKLQKLCMREGISFVCPIEF